MAADSEALTHYQHAFETYTKAFGDKWDPIQRGILERKMGQAFYRRGDHNRAMEYLQKALVDFGRPRLPESQGKMRLAILRELCIQGGYRLLSRWLTKAKDQPCDPVIREIAQAYEAVSAELSCHCTGTFSFGYSCLA